MELKINEVQLPQPYTFNYEELKNQIVEKASFYEAMVYTDEQINTAKADKANLNKLKKALNDERIRLEKEYMQPFNDFKSKVNEIISIIDKSILAIDTRLKNHNEQRKEKRLNEIKKIFDKKAVPEWLQLEQIFNDKWLNASVSLKSINEDIEEWLEMIDANLATLNSLPEFGFEAKELYKQCLDINKAIAEGKRLADIQKRKEEIQTTKQAEPKQETAAVDEVKQWIGFRAYLSTSDAKALKEFFNSRNIEFEAIK